MPFKFDCWQFRRFLLLVGVACLFVLIGAFVTTPGRLVLLGRLRGEGSYQGLPTCYWHRELGRYDELWSPLSGDWHLVGRDGASSDRVVGLLLRSDVAPIFPLLEGDFASLSVLQELLAYPDLKARRTAATGLGALGPQAVEAAPALVQIAQSTHDYALYLCACDALRNICPQRMNDFHLERPLKSFTLELNP